MNSRIRPARTRHLLVAVAVALGLGHTAHGAPRGAAKELLDAAICFRKAGYGDEHFDQAIRVLAASGFLEHLARPDFGRPAHRRRRRPGHGDPWPDPSHTRRPQPAPQAAPQGTPRPPQGAFRDPRSFRGGVGFREPPPMPADPYYPRGD